MSRAAKPDRPVSEPADLLLAASRLFLRRRWEEADQVLSHGLARFPDVIELVFLKGLVAQKRRAHAEAVGLFHRALAMGPARCEGAHPEFAGYRAHEALGQSYLALGLHEEAAAQFEAAHRLEPGYSGSLASLVAACSGRVADAALLERLERLLGPDRSALSRALLDGGRPDLALEVAEAEAGVAAPELARQRGRALLALSRYEEAARALGAGGELLVAVACSEGRSALPALVRRSDLTAADYREAASFCLAQAEFWDRVAARPRAYPAWVRGQNAKEPGGEKGS
ncbi:MAG: hypothetical protein ACOY94_29205 [Bacillota bacterium]